MKVNHLILTFAAAATLAACSSEMDTPTLADDTQTVTFTAQLPGGLGRSYGDGTTATNLIYAVYDSDKKLLTNLTGTSTFEGLKASVTLTLINGKEYSVVFWASAEGSPYTFDPATATITADYTNTLCNDERLDAFTKTLTVTPSSTDDTNVSVILKRPFAQLNIGTNDLADAKSAGLSDNATIAVTVKNVCTTLNLLSGEAGGAQDVTFGYGAFPDPNKETFPVGGYDYLAMNYLLVGKDSSTHDVSFQVNGISASKEYTEVPLKANYRTNLYGTLLTSKSTFDIEIEIDPTFEDFIITYNGNLYDNLSDAIADLDPDGTAEENRILIWSGSHELHYNEENMNLYKGVNVNVTFEGMNDNVSVTIADRSKFYSWGSSNIIFKNLNVKTSAYNISNCRFQLYDTALEFIGCKIEGEVTIVHFLDSQGHTCKKNGSCSFENCDFTSDSDEWGCLSITYVPNVEIKNCNFNNRFKSSWSEICQNITIERCNFTNENAFSNIAAIEYKNWERSTAGTININNTTASGFDYGLYKDSSSSSYQGKVTVIVDGVTQ